MVSRGEPRLLRARPRRRGDTWYKTWPSGPLQTAAQDRSCHPSARSLKFILNSPPTSLDHCSGLPTLEGAARKSFQNINQMVTAWFSALPAMTPCCAWCGRCPSSPLRSPGHLLPPSPLPLSPTSVNITPFSLCLRFLSPAVEGKGTNCFISVSCPGPQIGQKNKDSLMAHSSQDCLNNVFFLNTTLLV